MKSATSSNRKSQKPDAVGGAAPVFVVRDEAKCDDCRSDILRGEFLFKDGAKTLCLECGDLDHLCYLPRGNAALTRRATKYSTLAAVVLKWSRARKQYERQGILVEEGALDRAEIECAADADVRAARQEREATKRELLDQQYVERFSGEILGIFPRCPPDVAKSIAEHACRKYSGRVGRSASAKQFDPDAITLAVRAHIRHVHTEYDRHLASGTPRSIARDMVADVIASVARAWRGNAE